MKIVQNYFNPAAALAVLSLKLLGPFSGVDAAASSMIGVECLKESPNVCIGSGYFTSPSPASICDPQDPNNCATVYMGGHSWSWAFVEGLEEGESDPAAIDGASTGMSVTVSIEDDNSACEITVGTDMCDVCSATDCRSVGDEDTIAYDCANLENGKSSGGKCEPFLDPFFYPFAQVFENEGTATESPFLKNVQGDDVSTPTPTKSPSGMASTATTIMFSTTLLILLGFGTFVLPI